MGDEFYASVELNRYVAALRLGDEPTATECERLLLEMGIAGKTLSEFRNRDWSALDVFTDEERATILGAINDAFHSFSGGRGIGSAQPDDSEQPCPAQ